ncbi:hypothetical protein [Spiroplasma endosymbiont of Notiophilus biguttatus]|uniref:hypothetical protein n=1 Tax=Spiroplasma endosymbiont of Notiophilus biguttatus TaxID=3066285 RepID=UPI00313CE088
MTNIYEYFNYKNEIIINSPKPEDLNSSQDILAILLYEFPTLNPNYIRVSNVHDNFAVCVGDNINYQGKVIIKIEKSTNLLKGENKHARTCWDYTIE